MGLNATFGADFKDFEAAVRDAKATVRDFSGTFRQVESDLQKTIRAFDGTKVQKEAEVMRRAIADVGGVSKLTAHEQVRVNTVVTEAIAKYRALGQDVPPALRKIAEETTHAAGATQKHGLSIKEMAAGYLAGMLTFEAARRAISATVEFLKSSVAAYAEAELAQRKLTAALIAQGQATPAVIGQYQQLQRVMSRATIFDDEAIAEMQALLVEVGQVMPAEMGKALKAATDLAAGLGIDLRTATLLVGKAFAGETGTLKRYGIVIDEVKLKTDAASAVTGAIAEKFGGQAAAAAETLTGQLAQLSNEWENLKEAIGGVIAQQGAVLGYFDDVKGIIIGVTDTVERLGIQVSLTKALIASLYAGPAGAVSWLLSEGRRPIAPAVLPFPATGISVTDAEMKALDEMVQKHLKAIEKQAIEAAKAARALATRLAEQLPGATRAWDLALDKPLDKIAMGGRELVRIMSTLEGATRAWSEALDRPLKLFMARQPTEPSATVSEGAAGGWLSRLFGGNIGSLLTAAIGGGIGGGVGGAVGAGAGVGISSLFEKISKGLGSVLGPVAGMLGGVVGGLIGKLFGPTEYQQANKQIAELKKSLLETYGSLENLGKVGGVAGKHLAAIWGIEGKKGLADFQSAIASFEDAIKRIAAAEEKLVGLQATRAADGLARWEDMKAAAEKYGISLDALGTRYQELQASASFAQLLSDYALLTESGADAGAVIAGMTDEINALVQTSVKFGTAIPENMRPLLQAMVENGQLLDENGNKIDDLSKLKFGEAIKTEWQMVTDAIRDLIKELKALKGDIEQVPKSVDIDVNYHVGTLPAPGSGDTGEAPTYHTGGIIGGARVLPFVRAHRGLALGEVPIIAQTGEGVLSRRGMATLGADTLRRLNAGIVVGANASQLTIEVPVVLDGQQIARVVARRLPGYVAMHGG